MDIQNKSWWDSVVSDNAPWLALGGYKAARALPGMIGRMGMGLAGAPGLAAAAGASVMNPTALNKGEQDLYVRGPDGKMMPNPNNPNAQPLVPTGSPMSPMPAIHPWPMLANGMNPQNPSVMGFPSASPAMASASAPLASPSPSPPSGSFLPPALGPLSAPGLQGPTGGFGPAPGGSGMPTPRPRPDAPPMDLAAPGRPPNSDNYGSPADNMGFGHAGPSSATHYSPLGFLTGAPSNGQFNLGNFLKGGENAQAAINAAPDKPFWNIMRMLRGGSGGGGMGGSSSGAIY